jgi:2-succinyl-6-hydroxy-2,4-cyclohexadiene-1-carboxylate synthase
LSIELSYEVRGTGEPLVLLHGFTGSRAVWGDLVDRLARRRRVIVFDLPGHGASPAPQATEDVRLPQIADALVRSVVALGAHDANWIGYSLGARVALHVAVAHPERVRALVLEGASPGIADSVERAARAAADAALADSIERDGLESFVDAWLEQPLFASQKSLSREVRVRERARRLCGTAAGYAAALRTMGAGTQEPLWERLGAIHAPVLLIAGALDVKYCALGRAMAAALDDARLAIVPGAGHAVHLERSDAWLDIVEPFLTGDTVVAPARAAASA